jgi:antitoxin component YwqK of YwqJK toxin-antitoxin module
MDDGVTVRATKEYVNGKCHGKGMHYYTSGKHKSLSTYVNDKKIATVKYDTQDNVTSIKRYENNLAHGKYIQFNNDGSCRVVCNYVNGKIHGKRITYHTSFVGVDEYENDLLHGECWQYKLNGNVISYSKWAFGKRNGESIKYHSNGVMLVKINYVDDLIADSEVINYYETGQVSQIKHYHKGVCLPHRSIIYRIDGRIHTIGSKYDTLITYNYTEFWPNGNVSRKVFIENDRPVLYYYHRNGEYSHREKYKGRMGPWKVD